MNFKDYDIKKSYKSMGDENFSKKFMTPMLKMTRIYRRSVGYFSSGVFGPIIDGLISLSRNGGCIKLVSSPHLNEEDVEAINLGYRKRQEIIENAFSKDFIDEINKLDDDKLQLLAALIANNTLDIKIAVTDTIGIYHDKLGILEDFDGNRVVFYGSANESLGGYKNNYEKIRTVKSWVESDFESVEDECDEFEALWNGNHEFVKTYDYRESAAKNILSVMEKRKVTKEKSEPIELRDYQKEAISAWVDNGYHGFYVMATGTGKTWTAIYSAKELLKTNPAMLVICAPYKHLVRQWAEDLEKVFEKAILIMVSSENSTWEQQLSQAIVRQRLQKDIQIVVVSTITSFYLERFQKTLTKSKQEKMLIVDEAHRFTSRDETLNDQFKYMLGLSATPFSGKNIAKGKELMDFFGGQVFSLSIEEALERKFLVPYNYFPIFVNATDEEEEKFNKKSALIASCYKNGVCIDPDNLVLHLRSRLRIISMAQEKIDKIEIILKSVKEKNHFIVYCGDGKLYSSNDDSVRHINFVREELGKLGYKASQFTASEKMDERMNLVESFNEGIIDSLAAIRCLDEGINIPSIEGALILASNDDYREFVQRRGRILRTYGNKKYANIYDVVVLPSTRTTKMAEIEFRRFYEYARLAINKDELLKQLSSLSSSYNLKEDDYITMFDDYKEADLDD